MAATRKKRQRRIRKHRSPFRRLPWIAAGLGTFAAGVAHAQSLVDMRTLFYKESDGRTQVIDPVLRLQQDLGDSLGQLDVLVSYDAISGASPTGGYPSLDVTTSASGHTIASGNFPQAQYKDSRKSLTLGWSRQIGANLPSVDLSYSKENDYLARGFGLSDSWTLFDGRGTLHAGVSFSRDVVSPVKTNLDYDKRSDGYSLGWTWVLGERDLFDVSASLTKLSGYLDDPYKIVPIGMNDTMPEHRPNSRDRRVLIGKYAHYYPWDGALKLSYRFYDDSWGIKAHTLELDYDQHLGSDWIVSPRIRIYSQTGATFYDSLFDAPKTYMSSDYRLSPMDSIMGELAATYRFDDQLSFNAGISLQKQNGRDRIHLTMGPRRDDDEGGGSPNVATDASAADLTVLTVSVGFTRRF